MRNSPMPVLGYVQIRQVCTIPENEADYPHVDQALYFAQTILCITHITLLNKFQFVMIYPCMV